MEDVSKRDIAQDGSQPFTNPRWEAFAIAYAALNNQGDAYQQAGFKPRTPNAARASGSRLLADVNIQARVSWLRAEAAKNFEMTPERAMKMYHEVYGIAREAKQTASMVSSVREMTILAGFRVERKSDEGPNAARLGQLTADAIFDRLEQAQRRRNGTTINGRVTSSAIGSDGSDKLRIIDRDS